MSSPTNNYNSSVNDSEKQSQASETSGVDVFDPKTLSTTNNNNNSTIEEVVAVPTEEPSSDKQQDNQVPIEVENNNNSIGHHQEQEQQQQENITPSPTNRMPAVPNNSESSIQNTPAGSFSNEHFVGTQQVGQNQQQQQEHQDDEKEQQQQQQTLQQPDEQSPPPQKREKSRSPPSNRLDYPLGVPTASHLHHHHHLQQQQQQQQHQQQQQQQHHSTATTTLVPSSTSASSISPPSSNPSPMRHVAPSAHHHHSNQNQQNSSFINHNQQQQQQQQHVGRTRNVVHANSEQESASTASVSLTYETPTFLNNSGYGNKYTISTQRDASSPSISSAQAQAQAGGVVVGFVAAVAVGSPMSIPYNLQRKTPPSVAQPHCHPHHLEHSKLYPSLVLNDDFWRDVLTELKSHDFPTTGCLAPFTRDDVNKWHDAKVCPLGFDQREWNLLVRNFDFDERPNGTFDSVAFKELLGEIGAPCTIAMATHLLMNMRCLESGRIRCETAIFAVRSIQRVIARRVVSDDLANQVHQKRVTSLLANASNNSNNNNGKIPGLNLNSLNQQQQQQSGSTTPRNAISSTTTPRGAGGINNNNNNNNNSATTPRSIANQNQQQEIQFMVHPGIHRPVVTPVGSPPLKDDSNNFNNKTPRSIAAGTARDEGIQQSQNQNQNSDDNKHNNQSDGDFVFPFPSSSSSCARPNTAGASPSRSSIVGGYIFQHGAPKLGEKQSTPRDDRVLLTEGVSGVMSRSPHRQTLKWATQQARKDQERQEELVKQQKFEELEDARRAKYGMKPRPRSTSRDPSERNGGGGHNNNLSAGRGGRAPSTSSVKQSATTALLNNPSSSLSSTSSSSASPSHRHQQQQQQQRLGQQSSLQRASQVQISFPTGEAHAVLMRARQQRADGAEGFLNAKARNGLISENPSVEYGAVLSADKTQMLWNSNQVSPVVTIHRSLKTGTPTPRKGVYQNKTTTTTTTMSTSMSPDRSGSFQSVGGILNSPVGHPSVVLTPNGLIDRRPQHWR